MTKNKNYTKSKIRNWLNRKLLKKHYLYKIIDGRIYQIEYHHFYYVAYYEKPTIKSLIRCLKNNHYIVWDCFTNFDIKNNNGTRCEIEQSCFRGFLNFKRKKNAQRILNAKVDYWRKI